MPGGTIICLNHSNSRHVVHAAEDSINLTVTNLRGDILNKNNPQPCFVAHLFQCDSPLLLPYSDRSIFLSHMVNRNCL